MVLLRKAKPLLVALPLALGGVRLAGGVEQKADYSVTATKYDTRPYDASVDFAGCGTDGCSPDYMNDGDLNDVPESRWSCETALEGTEFECYATFDLGSSQSLTKLTIYFHKSDDEDRATNPFIVSTSTDGTTYTTSIEDVNTIPTPLGEGEDFAFPTGSSGRYVRFTGELADEQWLSVNEAEIYVDVATPAPVVPETPAPIPRPTPVPTVEVTIDVATPSPIAVATPSPTAVSTVAATPVDRGGIATMAPAAASIAPTGVPAPVAAPTPGPTPIGGPACGNVTVSNAGDLNGEYVSSLNGGSVTYVSTGVIAATIASSDAPAQCADSTASDCIVNRWQITPSDADSTLPTYVVYDEALHPSTINEVWLRLDNCGTGGCQSSPAELTILCGDGTTASGSGTPAPASVTASDCGVIEVAGTSGAESDGFYYDDGSELGDDVTQYGGYDVVNGELTSNGRSVVANRVDSTCATTTTSTGADACSWRQWWIEPSSSGTVSYFTYDEAGHPVDIAAGALWYTSDDTVVPYDGAVVVTCAPDPPTLTPTTSPAPTDGGFTAPTTDDDGTATRMPVEGTYAPGTTAPVVVGREDGDGDGDGGSNTVVIAASVAGGVALLAILGAVAYKLKKNPPPPPSYDDLVGA